MIRSFATTTTFQQTVTTLSLHNQISTLTTTSLQHLRSLLFSKKYFLSLNIKFYQKPVSLMNKLQPLSYQSKSNTTPRLPLHTSQPAPKIYKTLLHYSHIPNTHKKTSRTLSRTTPKYILPQRLVLLVVILFVLILKSSC